MPVAAYALRMAFERRFEPSGRPGSTPETSLRGALFAALVEAACLDHGACAATGSGHPCRQRAACSLGWLYQPRCEYQRRDHASPINLWINPVSATIWDVQLVLWGRRAADYRDHVFRAFEYAGGRGLGDCRGLAPFACEWSAPVHAPLAAYCSGAAAERAVLSFETPCQSAAENLQGLLGNLAHDLTQWALVDSGDSGELGKRGCDALADAARVRAAAGLAAVAVDWRSRQGTELGLRASRSNRGRFNLRGFVGTALLDGDLQPAWPWLVALSLRGAGGRRGFGMGRVGLRPG